MMQMRDSKLCLHRNSFFIIECVVQTLFSSLFFVLNWAFLFSEYVVYFFLLGFLFFPQLTGELERSERDFILKLAKVIVGDLLFFFIDSFFSLALPPVDD